MSLAWHLGSLGAFGASRSGMASFGRNGTGGSSPVRVSWQPEEDAMTMIPIRDTSLFVDVVGDGYPLVLMHGGPGLDHWSLNSFRGVSDRYTLIFYDHRTNGRSLDAPVESM